MGNRTSQDRLQLTANRAAGRAGKVAISSRYKRLPKKLEDDYEVQSKVLGTGYNGSVFMATSKSTHLKYAVKGFHLHGVGAEKMEQLEAECEIFLSMDHPHVARLVDVYESETQLQLVMECMEGGELFERLTKRKRFSEKDASLAIYQMLLAVNYIHGKGIVHRDLKLENFLYERQDTDHLKLIDFGFSHIWKPNTLMQLSCGTLAYVAPEVLKKSYTSKCDLWSMGVILFILLAGYMPFSGPEKTMRKNIDEANYSWKPDKWKNISPEAQELVRWLLTKDPQSRPSADEALAHSFLNKRKNSIGGVESETVAEVDQSTADALVGFAKASQFRRACMSVMAWSLTNEERSQVRDMFIAMDKNQKGTITLYELKEVLTNKFSISDDQVKPIFEALDTSNNEEIHYTEFLAAMVSTRISMHDDLLMQTFQRFDVDNSGFITIDNLRVVLGESFSGADLEKLIAEADFAKDGRISYAEFIAYLKEDGADGHLEAAAKIVDTERAKDQAPAFGTLAWARNKGEGLVGKGHSKEAVGKVEPSASVNSESTSSRSQGLQLNPNCSMAPQHGSATSLVEQPAPKAQTAPSKSRACVLL
jgi:calcium-dependent protein kinase